MFPSTRLGYRAALKGKWKAMINYYMHNKEQTLVPATVSGDFALHMAVHSKTGKPLNTLLDILEEYKPLEDSILTGGPMQKNFYGNTPLHEAVIAGNFEAVKILASNYEYLLSEKNWYGETPLFRAASFADTKIVKFLAEKCIGNGILPIHHQRDDSSTILQMAIQAERIETALMLVKRDEELLELKNRDGQTALHFLADMPSAFKSGYGLNSMGIIKTLVYCCLPTEDDNVEQDIEEWEYLDSQSCLSRNLNSLYRFLNKVLKKISLTNICNLLFRGWPMIKRIWDDKKKHASALRLAKLLIKKDVSWRVHDLEDMDMEVVQFSSYDESTSPLLIATSNGIVEIVREALETRPEVVENLANKMGQNLLHLAVMHRRREIFYLVKKMSIPFVRLSQKIDQNGYTLLHHVAATTRGTRPGPALQLQEELKWFERVKKAIPAEYVKRFDMIEQKTAQALFETNHEKQLVEAKSWVKDTSQSCSTVAVLVATVVFAAAYTLPGGSNDKGIPNFLGSRYFMVFTSMDVVSLASSLTSIVMFLSALSSPFELRDFYKSLPWRLMLGFFMLYLSLATALVAFGATILLVFCVEGKATTLPTLISVAAFLPIFAFAVMHFRLYCAFAKDFFLEIVKVLPVYCSPCYWLKKNNLWRNWTAL